MPSRASFVRSSAGANMCAASTGCACPITRRPTPSAPGAGFRIFYWSAKTDMACMRACVEATRDHAYAHHIQRLMVLGNFALLAGITPREVQEWYLLVYADAYEWGRTARMCTAKWCCFADGGLLASKTLCRLRRLYRRGCSDYCKSCRLRRESRSSVKKPARSIYLYWNFLIENEDRLKGNPRMGMPYRNLARMSDERRAAIRRRRPAHFSIAIGAVRA